MPAEPEPPELARLVDYAERSRDGDWSLRSALVRYAQSRPRQVSDVLDLVRRIEFALQPHARLLVTDGPRLWQALHGEGTPPATADALVVELLREMQVLDDLAEVLVAWAVERTGDQPDAAVDAAVGRVAERLDQLGVGREERMRPPRRRG